MSDNKMPHSVLEHEPNAGHLGGFFAGLLLGGLAGAGMMLLVAPQSGKRTRADIRHKSAKLRDQASETMEDAMDEVRTKARHIEADVRKEAKELEHRGKEMLDDQMDRASTAVADVKTAVHGS